MKKLIGIFDPKMKSDAIYQKVMQYFEIQELLKKKSTPKNPKVTHKPHATDTKRKTRIRS